MKISKLVNRKFNELKELYDIVGTEQFTTKTIRGKYSLTSGETSALLKNVYEEKSGVINRTYRSPYYYQFTD